MLVVLFDQLPKFLNDYYLIKYCITTRIEAHDLQLKREVFEKQ